MSTKVRIIFLLGKMRGEPAHKIKSSAKITINICRSPVTRIRGQSQFKLSSLPSELKQAPQTSNGTKLLWKKPISDAMELKIKISN